MDREAVLQVSPSVRSTTALSQGTTVHSQFLDLGS